jgi:hypothetical protein
MVHLHEPLVHLVTTVLLEHQVDTTHAEMGFKFPKRHAMTETLSTTNNAKATAQVLSMVGIESIQA